MIVLPKGLTQIGDEAFYGCSGFSGNIVVVPNPDVSIGKRVFRGMNMKELRTAEPEFVEVVEDNGNGS